ncbi:hypothetical protein Tco_0773925 [Tanacetum coccineum]|uniref:Uncharacterized protein n=1 Tax=Tanacetum coccineum TaxID=301880 RepID=A0ABQ4ZM76_9ASTR
MEDDYILGNLKFVPKGESVEVFGMAIPDPLITEAIQQSSYYPKYLKMVAENTKNPSRKCTGNLQHSKPSKRKLPQKVRRGKPTFQLVDEDDEARQDDDPDLDLAKKLSLEAHQEKGEEEGNDADLERAIKLSLDPTFLPQGRAPVGGVTIRDPVSEATPKLHEVVGKGKAVVTEEQVAHSLIDLSKKKRTTDQFILVRRDQTPPDSTTGPSSQPDDDTSEKTKLDDALLKVLERHTADLIEKYSCYWPRVCSRIKESEKIRIGDYQSKKEQDDEKQDSNLLHQPGFRPGRSTKKRRSDSAASGSAKPPPKDDDQSLKKPRESDASTSKQHTSLTPTGWQITDTRDAGADSSMHISDPESEHSEQSSDDISMQDEGK